MIKTSKEIRTAMERLHLVNKTIEYTPVYPTLLRFARPTGGLVPHGIACRRGVVEAEGILIYDPESKQYLGYFPGDPAQHRQTLILPCTNGAQYDTTGQEHPAPAPVETKHGTCTVIGPVEDQ